MFSAQATFEDALEIYREIFQKEELADRDAVMAQLTETLCNIGSIQNKRRNFEGAIESFREAVELQQGIMGHDHPRVIASLDNLGYSFSKSKSYNQALACYRQMLTAQISHFGELTMECCDTLKKQIVIFGKLQNKQGAIKAVASYLESAKTRSDQNDPIVVELEQMLVDLQSVKKRTGRSKARKAEKGDRRRDRSLDCFDRILFDRKSRLCEF
jgi:tetratricopeptide (TPR) repeat protein